LVALTPKVQAVFITQYIEKDKSREIEKIALLVRDEKSVALLAMTFV
jgi:hypothetical protein